MPASQQKSLSAIYATMSRIRGLYTEEAKSRGMTYYEARILYMLCEEGACTQKEIYLRHYMPKQTVNNIMVKLEKEAIISFMPNPADRREKLITLTDEGADYARDRLSAIRAIESRAFEKMGPSQMALMSELLSRYSALLEEAVTEADPSGRA